MMIEYDDLFPGCSLSHHADNAIPHDDLKSTQSRGGRSVLELSLVRTQTTPAPFDLYSPPQPAVVPNRVNVKTTTDTRVRARTGKGLHGVWNTPTAYSKFPALTCQTDDDDGFREIDGLNDEGCSENSLLVRTDEEAGTLQWFSTSNSSVALIAWITLVHTSCLKMSPSPGWPSLYLPFLRNQVALTQKQPTSSESQDSSYGQHDAP